MPSGNELILGFTFEDFPLVESALGIKFPSVCDHDAWDDFTHSYAVKLKSAWQRAMWDMKFTPAGKKGARGGNGLDYPVWVTPLGEREFSPWRLEFLIEGEFDETEKEAVFGVPISSRYFPTFADWRNSHGTMINIKFGTKEMEIAQKRIVEAVPCFEKASWIVKERWY